MKRLILLLFTTVISMGVHAQPPGSGWGNPVFADEFNGSSVNTNIWRVRNEANTDFFANMVTVANGVLTIKNDLTTSSVASGKRGGWVDSKQLFGNGADFPKYGYFEARIRINRQDINFNWTGGKIWPTWWIWGGNYRNGGPAPSGTELDVMEYSRWTNFKANDNATSSHHYFNQNTINGKKKFDITDKNSPRDQFNWHRWGVLWTPTQITYYYDGVPFGSSDQPGDAAADVVPSKLIFSSSPHVATHRDLVESGAPKVSDILPTFQVDWVRVWQGGNPGGSGGNTGGGNDAGATTVNIPGTLEAENSKPLTGGVRIVDAPGGKKALGYIKNNTYSEHFIEVPSGGGTYAVDVYASSGGSGGTIDFTIGGNTLASLNVPKTNGWNDYKKVSTTNVSINGGVKTVRLVYKGTGNFLFNLDGLVFRNTSGGGNTGGSSSASFDFGTGNSPLQSAYTRITQTSGNWTNTSGLDSRDRGAGPNNINRDFIFSAQAKTFEHNVQNGTYDVTVTFGDRDYARSGQTVKAEGQTKASNVSTNANQFLNRSFQTTVNDGKLSLEFSTSTSNNVWCVTRVTIAPAANSGGANNAPLTCDNAPIYNSSQTYSAGERVINNNDRRLYERTVTGWDFIAQCASSARGISNQSQPQPYLDGFDVVATRNNGLTDLNIRSFGGGDVSVDIYSISGKSVYSRSFNTPSSLATIPLHQRTFSSGVYIAKVSLNGETKTIKFGL